LTIYNILKTATVAVAPMKSGSGMQNKILEAMACSIPIVTTTKGLGDLKAINNRDLLVADKPIDFTTMVLQLLQSKLKSDYIGSNGNKYVTKHHNWDNINNKFCKIITKIK
jgi:glycosyltransferase involved in cell wall biosynthesis